MLGRDLMLACEKAGVSAVAADLPELDITDPLSFGKAIPDCGAVVNCAAYTAVDDAEKNGPLAFAVNGAGAGNLAAYCAGRGIPLVHISTDYVFDGQSGRPYKEDDPVRPLNVYGESKLDGERRVMASGCRFVIVRTQSLYGIAGKNFVATILGRLREGKELKVVTDQTSCPTYTPHLAGAILRILAAGRSGIVNVAASNACTWHEFAVAIAGYSGFDVKIGKTVSAEYRAPARRPAFSVLDTALYTSWTGHVMPTWQTGLREYLAAARS